MATRGDGSIPCDIDSVIPVGEFVKGGGLGMKEDTALGLDAPSAV